MSKTFTDRSLIHVSTAEPKPRWRHPIMLPTQLAAIFDLKDEEIVICCTGGQICNFGQKVAFKVDLKI